MGFSNFYNKQILLKFDEKLDEFCEYLDKAKNVMDFFEYKGHPKDINSKYRKKHEVLTKIVDKQFENVIGRFENDFTNNVYENVIGLKKYYEHLKKGEISVQKFKNIRSKLPIKISKSIREINRCRTSDVLGDIYRDNLDKCGGNSTIPDVDAESANNTFISDVDAKTYRIFAQDWWNISKEEYKGKALLCDGGTVGGGAVEVIEPVTPDMEWRPSGLTEYLQRAMGVHDLEVVDSNLPAVGDLTVPSLRWTWEAIKAHKWISILGSFGIAVMVGLVSISFGKEYKEMQDIADIAKDAASWWSPDPNHGNITSGAYLITGEAYAGHEGAVYYGKIGFNKIRGNGDGIIGNGNETKETLYVSLFGAEEKSDDRKLILFKEPNEYVINGKKLDVPDVAKLFEFGDKLIIDENGKASLLKGNFIKHGSISGNVSRILYNSGSKYSGESPYFLVTFGEETGPEDSWSCVFPLYKLMDARPRNEFDLNGKKVCLMDKISKLGNVYDYNNRDKFINYFSENVMKEGDKFTAYCEKVPAGISKVDITVVYPGHITLKPGTYIDIDAEHYENEVERINVS